MNVSVMVVIYCSVMLAGVMYIVYMALSDDSKKARKKAKKKARKEKKRLKALAAG